MDCTTASERPSVSCRGFCGICNSNQPVCLFEFRSRQLFAKARFWLNLLGTAYMIYLGIHIALDQIRGAGRNRTPPQHFQSGDAYAIPESKIDPIRHHRVLQLHHPLSSPTSRP